MILMPFARAQATWRRVSAAVGSGVCTTMRRMPARASTAKSRSSRPVVAVTVLDRTLISRGRSWVQKSCAGVASSRSPAAARGRPWRRSEGVCRSRAAFIVGDDGDHFDLDHLVAEESRLHGGARDGRWKIPVDDRTHRVVERRILYEDRSLDHVLEARARLFEYHTYVLHRLTRLLRGVGRVRVLAAEVSPGLPGHEKKWSRADGRRSAADARLGQAPRRHVDDLLFPGPAHALAVARASAVGGRRVPSGGRFGSGRRGLPCSTIAPSIITRPGYARSPYATHSRNVSVTEPSTGSQTTMSAGSPGARTPPGRPKRRAVLPVARQTSCSIGSSGRRWLSSWSVRRIAPGTTPVPPGRSLPTVTRCSSPRSSTRRSKRRASDMLPMNAISSVAGVSVTSHSIAGHGAGVGPPLTWLATSGRIMRSDSPMAWTSRIRLRFPVCASTSIPWSCANCR